MLKTMKELNRMKLHTNLNLREATYLKIYQLFLIFFFTLGIIAQLEIIFNHPSANIYRNTLLGLILAFFLKGIIYKEENKIINFMDSFPKHRVNHKTILTSYYPLMCKSLKCLFEVENLLGLTIKLLPFTLFANLILNLLQRVV